MGAEKTIGAGEAEEDTIFSMSDCAPEPDPEGKPSRRLTTLRVGTITIRERRELCLIRNISAGGLRAHNYSPAREGDRVSVELKTNHQTHGTISWVRDGSVGIAFDAPIDIEEMLAVAALSEDGHRPRMPRVEVDRLGEIRVGSRVFPVNTCDISQGGVRIEIDHPLTVGDQVVLTFEKWRPIEGVVRWFEEDQGGVSFNQVIPFQELMTWLRA